MKVTVKFSNANKEFEIVRFTDGTVLAAGAHRTQEAAAKKIDKLVKQNNWIVYVISHV